MGKRWTRAALLYAKIKVMAEPVHDENLAKQLKGIRGEIDQKREELTPGQVEGESIPEKTILHHVVGEKLGKPSPAGVGDAQVKAPASSVHDETPSYELPELKGQVEELVQLAFQKNIDTAVKEVKKKNDSALIDAFHDALVDELYDRLVSEDKLKQIE